MSVLRLDKLGHPLWHNGVLAVFMHETLCIDAGQTKDHCRVLHSAVLPYERREVGHCNHVRIPTSVDSYTCARLELTLLSICENALDLVTVEQDVRDYAVEEHVHTTLVQEMVGRFPPDEMIVHARIRLAILYWRAEPAPAFKQPYKLI